MRASIESVIAKRAPALADAGFLRRGRGRVFLHEGPDSVGAIAFQISSDGSSFTVRGAVAYRLWSELLKASESLKDPIAFPDRRVFDETGEHPSVGVGGWWPIDDSENTMADSQFANVVTGIQKALDPKFDRDQLFRAWPQLTRSPQVLGRLYLWLTRLGGASGEELERIRDALIAAGGGSLAVRIEGV